MTFPGGPGSRWRWWVLAGVLVLVGSCSIWVGLRGHRAPLALPAHPSASRAVGGQRIAPTSRVGLTRSTPVALRIPSIGISVFVSQLGLNADQSVQVPTDFQVPGWYRLGPSPGQVGSAVILGHVDSRQGPGVFYKLGLLAAGNDVEVTLADGVVAHFVVTAVAMYPKDQFPAQEVYGSHGFRGLQLVTCGGTFDSQSGHYLSNVVVYTSLVRATPAVPPHAASTRAST